MTDMDLSPTDDASCNETRHAAERIFERIKAADENIDRLKTRGNDAFLVLRAEDHRGGLIDALHAIGWRVNYRRLLAGELCVRSKR